MCDLLDAAAALAGVPLLALVQVRINSGDINPKAWRKESKLRKAIIEKSKRHHFTDADFKAISSALKELEGRGNIAAWKYVRAQIPKGALIRSLAWPDPTETSDAIDDMGTDTPDRVKVSGLAYARDPKIREAVQHRAKGKCEYCGELGFERLDGTHYVETHHIIALAKDGADRRTNVIAVCPNHHREAHFGNRGAALEREMIKIVMNIECKAKLVAEKDGVDARA